MKKNLVVSSMMIVVLTMVAAAGIAATADAPNADKAAGYAVGGDTVKADSKAKFKGSAVSKPRFTNPDGTTPILGSVVVDQVTGLMWSKDGNAPGPSACSSSEKKKTWKGAVEYVSCLNKNKYLDYSDWRLPSINELESLVNAEQSNNAAWLNSQGFNNAQIYYYWSSTTYAYSSGYAWYVYMHGGIVGYSIKTVDGYAWPVRGGKSTS